MSTMGSHLIHRALACPSACIFKLLLFGCFIYALHVAVYHQADFSSHLYLFLIDSIGGVAVLAIVLHRNCQLRLQDRGIGQAG